MDERLIKAIIRKWDKEARPFGIPIWIFAKVLDIKKIERECVENEAKEKAEVN